MKIDQKTFLFDSDPRESIVLRVYIVFKTLLSTSENKNTYFYDILILCEKQSDFWMSPIVDKEIIVFISIWYWCKYSTKQILPCLYWFSVAVQESLQISIRYLNYYWNFSIEFYFILY